MAKEKTSPEEWKEDKEFPLVFSRIKIKPASCNQDDEKNYDPCKKVKDQERDQIRHWFSLELRTP